MDTDRSLQCRFKVEGFFFSLFFFFFFFGKIQETTDGAWCYFAVVW